MKFSKNIDLLNLNFKKDWTQTFSGGMSRTIGSKHPDKFKIVIEGDGTLTIKFGYWFKFKVEDSYFICVVSW